MEHRFAALSLCFASFLLCFLLRLFDLVCVVVSGFFVCEGICVVAFMWTVVLGLWQV